MLQIVAAVCVKWVEHRVRSGMVGGKVSHV